MLYASALASTLFRCSAYVFLRVIPMPLGLAILPALYAAYVISLYLWPPKNYVSAETKPKDKEGKNVNPNHLEVFDYIRAILLSIPISSQPLRTTNFIINTLLLLAATDFVLYPFIDTASAVVFTRVGAVYHDRIKIQVRYPHFNTSEGTLRVVWRESNDIIVQGDSWRDGPALQLNQENDWVDTVNLSGLWPKTEYEYMLSVDKTILPYPSSPIRFRTFPDPRLPSGNRFRFIACSSFLPNFPYVPSQGRTIKGFDLLAHYLFPEAPLTQQPNNDEAEVISSSDMDKSTVKPHNAFIPPTESSGPVFQPRPADFVLLLGDFIYPDVATYIGDDAENYRRLYRRNYQSKSFRKIYERLPIFSTYNDHEMINNFAAQGNGSIPPFPSASDASTIYSALANYDSPDHGQHYYDFRYGDVAFFVMDTRRSRSGVVKDDMRSLTMLGDRQLTAFYQWLSKVNQTSTFKFIITSVPFTSLAATDSWAGYTHEKTTLLHALHSVPNIIILSGDRHEFAHVEFNGGDHDHNVQEFSTSPLSTFSIPFSRSLRIASDEVVTRSREVRQVNGTEETTTITEEVPRERVVEYVANGNYKWSSIEVDTTLAHPVVRLQLMIDGSAAYHYSFVGTPVKLQSSTALGALVSGSFKDILDRMGIRPFEWF